MLINSNRQTINKKEIVNSIIILKKIEIQKIKKIKKKIKKK